MARGNNREGRRTRHRRSRPSQKQRNDYYCLSNATSLTTPVQFHTKYMQPHDYTPYSWLDDDNNDDHGYDTTRLFRHGGSEDKASDSDSDSSSSDEEVDDNVPSIGGVDGNGGNNSNTPRPLFDVSGAYSGIGDLRDMNDILFLNQASSNIRTHRWDHKRTNWYEHVAQLEHENAFVNEYTMSLQAHGKLVRILDHLLQRKECNSRGSDGPILVEHIIAIGLRILQGGRPKDMRHIFGTSRSAAYAALDDFIDAVNHVFYVLCDHIARNAP